MPKGYIIVRMTVTDPDAYKTYAAMASEAMRIHGVKPLARGGRPTGEGIGRAARAATAAPGGRIGIPGPPRP